MQCLGFNQFVYERETKPANDPTVLLFDQVILAKKNRDRRSFFNKSSTSFLSNTSDHLWRSAATTPANSRFPGDYRSIITRSNVLFMMLRDDIDTDSFLSSR